jgi:hypothetical protein
MKFLTVCLAVILLSACANHSSDEERVRAVIAAAEQAAEARDASDVLEFLASDYSDSQGSDRTRLQNFLRGYFLANPKIELLVSVSELEIPVPGLARARVAVASLPAGDRATFRVEFRQEGGEWRVARADRIRD